MVMETLNIFCRHIFNDDMDYVEICQHLLDMRYHDIPNGYKSFKSVFLEYDNLLQFIDYDFNPNKKTSLVVINDITQFDVDRFEGHWQLLSTIRPHYLKFIKEHSNHFYQYTKEFKAMALNYTPLQEEIETMDFMGKWYIHDMCSTIQYFNFTHRLCIVMVLIEYVNSKNNSSITLHNDYSHLIDNKYVAKDLYKLRMKLLNQHRVKG